MTASRDWEYEYGQRNLHIIVEQHERIMELTRKLESSQADELLKQAYAAGFAASGEGYNNEYPFSDGEKQPDKDPDWCKRRDENIKAILEENLWN